MSGFVFASNYAWEVPAQAVTYGNILRRLVFQKRVSLTMIYGLV